MVIQIGTPAPPVPGASRDGPHALLFYKVTCPTCQMAAPVLNRFEDAYAGRMHGVGQDPTAKLTAFSAGFGVTFPSVSDAEPYQASSAYGIENVPTMVVVDDSGRVADVVESWDREGYNRASTTLAGLLGLDPVVISDARDGLPAFRPG
jgi:thiol-disulfide isomerase/thioredoxin